MSTGYIGILGGMGSYSSVYAYKRLLDAHNASTDQEYPQIIIDNNSQIPSRIEAALKGARKEELISCVNESLARMHQAYNVSRAFICCNSAHVFLDEFVIPEGMYLLDMVSCAAKQLDEEQQYIVLGTQATIELSSLLHYANVHAPPTDIQAKISKLIQQTKSHGVTQELINTFANIIESLGSACVVMCTELSMLNEHLNTEWDIVDTLSCTINELAQ